MNKDLIYSSIKLLAPHIREFSINAGMAEGLAFLNREGLETKTTLTVAGTTGTPESRASGSAYNYYSDKKCLILPSNALQIYEIWVGTQKLTPTTFEYYQAGLMPENSYVALSTGEIYLATALADADVVTFNGRFRITNWEQLPDYWMEFFKYSALLYYYSTEQPNLDKAKEYTYKMSKEYTAAKNMSSPVFTKPNLKNNPLKA